MVRERGGAALERAAETAWQAGRRGRGRRGGGGGGAAAGVPTPKPRPSVRPTASRLCCVSEVVPQGLRGCPHAPGKTDLFIFVYTYDL